MVQHADIDHTGITGVGGGAHNTAHQNGGGDEVSVAGLSGLLADGQTPLAHKTSHQDGGSDEISLTGLAGESVTPQPPKTHAASHDGGADDLNGALTPNAHAASHQNGGSDEIDVTGLTGAGGGAGPTIVRKASDESVANNTLQDDNDLVFAIGASEVWVAQLHLFLTCASATPDFKYGFTAPAGATIRYGNHAMVTGITGVTGDAHMQTLASGNPAVGVPATGAGPVYITIVVSVANGGTPGTVQLQWAQQNTDAVNSMQVLAGSYIIAHEV